MACTLDDLLDNSNCIDGLSEKEKLAAQAFFLCAAGVACAQLPADCTVDTLQESVACIKDVSPARLISMQVYSDYLAAVDAGASPSLAMDDIQEGIKCLSELDDHALRAMVLLLRCNLRECVS